MSGKKIIEHRSPMQTDKSQPSGKRIMPEMRRTSFPALSIHPRVWISRSASKTDVRFYLCSMRIPISSGTGTVIRNFVPTVVLYYGTHRQNRRHCFSILWKYNLSALHLDHNGLLQNPVWIGWFVLC